MHGGVNVGTTPTKDKRNISIGTFNSNGFKTHDTIGAKGQHGNTNIGNFHSTGMGTTTDIYLI